MFIHAAFLFPETAGKTLEQIEFMFEDTQGIPGIGTPAWKTKVQTQQALALERDDRRARKLHGDDSDHIEERAQEKV